ncbi:hypothetical protein [Paenibacillus sp. BIHB 4019]|uniref:hypothetical protein n=1 Tax=Paenibacillus sp. BIHB 4019 TaxID=1870819 RepID=UPI001C0ECA3B|nr:hypothetical protein [Paenibacillus sp. BIHB 4019]
MNVIDTLQNEDVYDFIFVTVRYDRSESALFALKDNQSKNIVTMTGNSIGFSSWLDIVGDRLLPAFPGFGGQIKDGVLHARFPPKILVATAFGEIDGVVTHSVSDIAMLSVLQTARTRKTAHQITVTFKGYLRAIQKSGVSIDPAILKMVLKFPNFILDLFFMMWQRTKMVQDMMLPDYADNANNEIVQLNNDLLKFLSQNDTELEIHAQ